MATNIVKHAGDEKQHHITRARW